MPNVNAQMQLRPAELCDAEAICRVRVLAWQAAYGEFMPRGYLDSLAPLANVDAWGKRLAQPSNSASINVVEMDDSVVGFSTADLPRYSTAAKCVELWALNVHPAYWRRGVGRALTLHAIDIARAQGFESVELWCISGNIPARANYESCGFSLTGRERSSPTLTGQPLHEILYAKVL